MNFSTVGNIPVDREYYTVASVSVSLMRWYYYVRLFVRCPCIVL